MLLAANTTDKAVQSRQPDVMFLLLHWGPGIDHYTDPPQAPFKR